MRLAMQNIQIQPAYSSQKSTTVRFLSRGFQLGTRNPPTQRRARAPAALTPATPRKDSNIPWFFVGGGRVCLSAFCGPPVLAAGVQAIRRDFRRA